MVSNRFEGYEKTRGSKILMILSVFLGQSDVGNAEWVKQKVGETLSEYAQLTPAQGVFGTIPEGYEKNT